MPTDSPDPRLADRRALRLGFGITVVFLVAIYINWLLAYLAPVFAAPLLQGSRAPTLREAAGVMAATCLIALACLLAGGVARIYPVLFMAALLPVLVWTLRTHLRGGNTLIVVVILCAVLLVPLGAKVAPEVARQLAASFVWNIGLSLVVASAMFALMPPAPGEAAPGPREPLPAEEAAWRGWQVALITWSYSVAYFAFDWTNIHTPLYIAIFALHLSLARTLSISGAILAANVAGGVIALLLYELVAMVPLFVFLAALMLPVHLVFARVMTSGTRVAPLAGAALSVMLILFGGAMSPTDENASAGFVDRLGELGMAAIYAILALYVLEAFRRDRPVGPAPERAA
ncbi:DUF2955 domain-containing protein [Roseomonas sp. PWR1]|uniref:DUF2955 domain-containing protein n=1 Tax=Roseomonas nitratireducens TaxID=2820810 RepID=A0ABS4AUI3_9PROT|nr:DUF2955 domain-containing protein [Neoroseomonas nitratireducens]MBP0464202.1 DUF2955 domain-containing protein [Neoroseomonas nitratireducens]